MVVTFHRFLVFCLKFHFTFGVEKTLCSYRRLIFRISLWNLNVRKCYKLHSCEKFNFIVIKTRSRTSFSGSFHFNEIISSKLLQSNYDSRMKREQSVKFSHNEPVQNAVNVRKKRKTIHWYGIIDMKFNLIVILSCKLIAADHIKGKSVIFLWVSRDNS